MMNFCSSSSYPERPGQVSAIAGDTDEIDSLRQIVDAPQPPLALPGFDQPIFGRHQLSQKIDGRNGRTSSGQGSGNRRVTRVVRMLLSTLWFVKDADVSVDRLP